ncbi:hypothetical protein AGMMS50267_17690 [Spirochaetia bacterium]|nr:hypothetical protein AGMMS50267_17690 [Spirochaetia bacterium]
MKNTQCARFALMVLLLGTLAALPVFAVDKIPIAPFTFPSTANAGRGGAHIAFTDNVDALFYNPAALQKARQRSLVEFSPRVIGPVFELLSAIPDLDFDNIGKVVNDIVGLDPNGRNRVPIGLDLGGPLAIGYAANGFGWGAWNTTSISLRLNGLNALTIEEHTDLIFNGGMAFNVWETDNHNIDAGFVVKTFGRLSVPVTSLNVMSTALGAVSGGDFDFTALMEDLSVPVLVGAGLDLGVTYRWSQGLVAAMTLSDVFTGAGDVYNLATLIPGGNDNVPKRLYTVPFTVNLGAAYTMQILPSFVDLSFMFDIHDFASMFYDYTTRLLENRKNGLLGLGFGVDAMFLKHYSVRLGLNEMLPAVGIGMKFGGFQFDVSFYGRELGFEPGDYPTYALDIGIVYRPEAKATSNFLTRGPIIDRRGGGKAATDAVETTISD